MRELSKGEQKKTLMGMELMAPTGNIFLEQPLANLDSFTSKRLQTFLRLLSISDASEFRV